MLKFDVACLAFIILTLSLSVGAGVSWGNEEGCEGGRDMRWDLLKKVATFSVAELEKVVAETRLSIECVAAVAKIYERHGKRHPSTYGVGDSEKSLGARLAYHERELADWSAVLKLVLEATGGDKPLLRRW